MPLIGLVHIEKNSKLVNQKYKDLIFDVSNSFLERYLFKFT